MCHGAGTLSRRVTNTARVNLKPDDGALVALHAKAAAEKAALVARLEALQVRVSHRVSLTVSLTVSPTVSRSPSPSLKFSLPTRRRRTPP